MRSCQLQHDTMFDKTQSYSENKIKAIRLFLALMRKNHPVLTPGVSASTPSWSSSVVIQSSVKQKLLAEDQLKLLIIKCRQDFYTTATCIHDSDPLFKEKPCSVQNCTPLSNLLLVINLASVEPAGHPPDLFVSPVLCGASTE